MIFANKIKNNRKFIILEFWNLFLENMQGDWIVSSRQVMQ